MKIAILGTRGIPNNYGGFEQFAEYISKILVNKGHELYVYNPSFHKYYNTTLNGVNIIRTPCPEYLFGGAAHFLYDYFCLKDAVKRKIDFALMCGYGTSAPALFFVKKNKTQVITNMDGFEWKRSKYNFFTKKCLKWFEKIAVKHSDILVTDHSIVQIYYQDTYQVKTALISYGAEIPDVFDETVLASYGLLKNNYFLVVARDEPENQIEFIISAWKKSGSAAQLCIVTNSSRLSKKANRLNQGSLSQDNDFHQNKLVFINGLYNYSELSSLRHFSLACIHGHTVGGTNPSLLEAMAAQSNIIAHDNPFHREILKENADYFTSAESLSEIIRIFNPTSSKFTSSKENNLANIKENFSWQKITDKYLALFHP